MWANLVATFFGMGRLQPGPGTWASAATITVWWAIARITPLSLQTGTNIGLATVAILIGIPAATRAARAASKKDPGFIVIDEVAGQLVSLIAVPVSWKSLLLGFILFRGFDILKPPPIRALEHLPEGTGIVLDDVGAGLYALAVMHLAVHFGAIS
jgi:phosphatidylglycerophosphatase A